MQNIRWNRKRVTTFAIGTLLVYLITSSKYNEYQVDTIIKNSEPEDVWNFVADFSKMKLLNPTIKEFRVLSDQGNLHHWKYEVEYLELLSHWPYWENKNKGHFSVRKLPTVEGGEYVVESLHKTCFAGFYCLKSIGEFKFSSINSKDTYCIETVQYQCPPFLSLFCRREVEYQRKEIMGNLRLHFEQKLMKKS